MPRGAISRCGAKPPDFKKGREPRTCSDTVPKRPPTIQTLSRTHGFLIRPPACRGVEFVRPPPTTLFKGRYCINRHAHGRKAARTIASMMDDRDDDRESAAARRAERAWADGGQKGTRWMRIAFFVAIVCPIRAGALCGGRLPTVTPIVLSS